MNNNQKGWIVLLAALGSLAGLLAIELKDVQTWTQVFSPGFIAAFLGHIATVIASFVGGNLMNTIKVLGGEEGK